MLHELRKVHRFTAAGIRRRFRDPYFDLIVWYDDGSLVGYQLCYGRQGREHAFTWWKDHDSRHDLPGKPPGIATDGDFPSSKVAERFLRESAQIDPEVALLVFETVIGCGSRIEEFENVI